MTDKPSDRTVAGAPLPFQALDTEGRIVAVNHHWEKLTGYSESEMLGHYYAELVPEDHIEGFMGKWKTLAETGELSGADCFIRRKDGAILNVRVFSSLDSEGGQADCMLVDITGFRKTERDLKESEERFRNLFELEPTPILIHDGAKTVLANSACATFLGYESPQALEGVPVASFVHPDDRAVVAERVRRMMRDNWTAPAVTERFVRPDGTIACGEILASPVMFDGQRMIHVIAIDLSERMAAEQALSESESSFRSLFEYSGDAIIVHDGRTVSLANRRARSVFGLDYDADVRGIDLFDFVHPASHDEAEDRIAALLSGNPRPQILEMRLLKADGTDWYAEARSVVLPIGGKPYVSTLLSDLTDRRRAEQELASYRDQLEVLLAQRTESLERAMRQLDAVTAVVSRTVEMRDPYTAGHQRRVAALAREIAQKMGMDPEDIGYLEVAAHLHDVGKVSVPAEILSRPSKLGELEFELVKCHVEAGYEIVRSANLPEPVAEIVYQHHERLDGSGYPRGLVSADLLPGARILMVADVVEAMCTHRPYRPALGFACALEEISAGSGDLFDPDVVAACHAVVESGFVFTDEF
jgi:PAS domain S-box-containing protein/putative nucleotidyltransferase with HDIG domain